MPTKRKWPRYLRGEPNYDNGLRCVLPSPHRLFGRSAESRSNVGNICKPMQYDEGTMHQHRSGRRQRSMPDQFGEKTEVTCDAEIESSPNYLVSRSADITQGKVCQYEDDSEPHLSAYPERCVSGTALRDTIGIDGETDDGNTIPPVEIGSLSVSSLLGSAVTGADTTSRLSKESISNSGLLIRCIVHGQPRVVQIKAELDIMLTDGEGLQYALEWNGPNALRPTFNLANVYMLGSRLDGAGYVDISCSHWVQFRQWAIAEVLAVIDSVLAQRDSFENGDIGITRLREYIKSAGFCVTKDGLLADVVLRGIFNFLDVCRYDFMHTAFQGGFMSTSMWLLCKSVFEVKYGRSNDATPLLRFLRELQFPQSRPDGRRLHILFQRS